MNNCNQFLALSTYLGLFTQLFTLLLSNFLHTSRRKYIQTRCICSESISLCNKVAIYFARESQSSALPGSVFEPVLNQSDVNVSRFATATTLASTAQLRSSVVSSRHTRAFTGGALVCVTPLTLSLCRDLGAHYVLHAMCKTASRTAQKYTCVFQSRAAPSIYPPAELSALQFNREMWSTIPRRALIENVIWGNGSFKKDSCANTFG